MASIVLVCMYQEKFPILSKDYIFWLLVLLKWLHHPFAESIPYLFGGGGSFCSNVSAKLAKNVWKTSEMDFRSYITTLLSLGAFIVTIETSFGNPNAFKVFHSSFGLPMFSVNFVSK